MMQQRGIQPVNSVVALHPGIGATKICDNNTPHASRQLCAPWEVSFFRGSPDA